MLRTLAATTALLVTIPVAAQARTTIVYDGHSTARQLATDSGSRYCTADVLRVNREERSADRQTCSRFVPRVNAYQLLARDAAGMAALLKSAIDRRPAGGGRPVHAVAVDEIGNEFRDPRPRVRLKTVRIGGRSFRIAAQHRVQRLPKGGWRIVRRPAPASARPGPAHPGSRLARAMKILADTPAPWGGSYASRVHFFAAPAFTTAIAAGNGPHFTLNKSGTRHVRAGWRGVMPALARAGGVWLAMYHGDGAPLNARTWRLGPSRVADYLRRSGGDAGRLHFVIGGLASAPAGSVGCSTAMACHWALARERQNAAILANGVGAWRLGSRTGEVAREHAATFG